MRIHSILIAATLTVAACGHDEKSSSATPYAPVSLSAAVVQSGAAAAPAFAPAAKTLRYGADVTLTSVRVVVGQVNLQGREAKAVAERDEDRQHEMRAQRREGMDDDAADSSAADDAADDVTSRSVAAVDFAGPYVFDLSAQTVTPSLAGVTIPAGLYKRVDLAMEPLSAAAADAMGLSVSDPVVGHSYVVEGWLNDVTTPSQVTAASVKLVIVGDQVRTYRVGLKQGLAVTAGALNDILLVFTADGWFPDSLIGQLRSGLATGAVSVDTSTGAPVVYLDANRNSSLAASFNQLFHGSLSVVKDNDGDDEIDPDETPEALTPAE